MRPTDRYELVRRRYDLAQHMIRWGARTATVVHWSGLSEYRVQQIARRYASARGSLRLGKSPYTPRYFTRTPEVEAHSFAFIYLAVESGVIPHDIAIDSRDTLPDIGRGEDLVATYELYRAVVQSGHISLERAISLVFAYASRLQLSIRCCHECHDWMLTQRFGRNIRCPFCRKDDAAARRLEHWHENAAQRKAEGGPQPESTELES
jgi:hypothetical protein